LPFPWRLPTAKEVKLLGGHRLQRKLICLAICTFLGAFQILPAAKDHLFGGFGIFLGGF